jgi:CAAX protease family protein
MAVHGVASAKKNFVSVTPMDYTAFLIERVNHIHTHELQPPRISVAGFVGATVAYAFVLLVFWFIAKRFAMDVRVGGHMASAFLCFALLLAPYWFFAFGLADVLASSLRSAAARVLAPALLVAPYLVFTVPRGEFKPVYAIIFVTVPIFLAALFIASPPKDHGFTLQDAIALIIVGAPIEFGLLREAFPHPGLGVLPKFLLMDALLYAYLVVRRLPGIGYDLRLRIRDLGIGLREWTFFAPIAIVLGLLIGFIQFRAYMPDVDRIIEAWLITFFFVALPEEFFFRGLLQNLLERSLGSSRLALVLASVIFGLSHFNKRLAIGAVFNWKYVLLASIAGFFYGRAWLDRRRLSTSAITHATVDVVWGLWFNIRP